MSPGFTKQQHRVHHTHRELAARSIEIYYQVKRRIRGPTLTTAALTEFILSPVNLLIVVAAAYNEDLAMSSEQWCMSGLTISSATDESEMLDRTVMQPLTDVIPPTVNGK